jgi:hypothetical protein
MTFLTPLAGLVAFTALAAVAAAVVAHRSSESVRRALDLPAPDRRRALLRPALGAVGLALLGLAAAQPALTRTSSTRVRRDAQALFVLDTSRSMAASASPTSPTRLDRAVAAAVRIRESIGDVESGVATLTDRVLPDLLPVADRPGFTGVVRRAVQIESPPPQHTAPRATTYGALTQIASGNVFAPRASRRIVVLLTDGESGAVDTSALANALPAAKGYRFAAVRFWHAGESVYDGDRAEAAYRPDSSGEATLAGLAAALGGKSFDESRVAAAGQYVRRLAGSGVSSRAQTTGSRQVTLAPYVALVGLLALLAGPALSRVSARGLRLTRQ